VTNSRSTSLTPFADQLAARPRTAIECFSELGPASTFLWRAAGMPERKSTATDRAWSLSRKQLRDAIREGQIHVVAADEQMVPTARRRSTSSPRFRGHADQT